LGDVVGKPGRQALRRCLPRWIDRERLAAVIANGENICEGAGVDRDSVHDLFDAGVDVITTGNHIWRRKGSTDLAAELNHLLRPANLPPAAPGRGWTVIETADGVPIAVINLMGRVFLEGTDCPFRAVDALLPAIKKVSRVVLVDMHAEATSEKGAMGWHLAGRVTAVLGTHTHIQTSDEIILPGGTAYLTDAGMCGPRDSVIGVDPALIVNKFITQLPVKFQVARGPVLVQGAFIDIDTATGHAVAIRRLREVVDL